MNYRLFYSSDLNKNILPFLLKQDLLMHIIYTVYCKGAHVKLNQNVQNTKFVMLQKCVVTCSDTTISSFRM